MACPKVLFLLYHVNLAIFNLLMNGTFRLLTVSIETIKHGTSAFNIRLFMELSRMNQHLLTNQYQE